MSAHLEPSRIGPACPKYTTCANHAKCHLCHGFSCFRAGNPAQAKGARNERQVVKSRDTVAHLRPGSGAVAHAKGDVIDLDALHECKDGYAGRQATRTAIVNARGRKSLVLQRGWLLKICQEALQVGKMPILNIHFADTPDDEQWSIVRAGVLFDLLAENRELRRRLGER